MRDYEPQRPTTQQTDAFSPTQTSMGQAPPWVAATAGRPAAADGGDAGFPTAGGAASVMSHWAVDAPVQRQEDGAQTTGPVHEAAQRGTAGAGSALPHLAEIQRCFGPQHDLSGIRAHVGGEAAAASRQIGAKAFATGDAVAFRDQPDLHTAAHEAAHVVQQRAGVHLKGGVGEKDDPYERHADAVADRVVQGQPAGDLLRPGPGGGATAAVQRSPDDEANAPGRKGVAPANRRLVITFILGADTGGFYAEATGYWGQAGKTDVLVKTVRTFSDILDYLSANPPSNSQPWGEINIVVHANERGGMGMKLDDSQSENIDQAALQQGIDKGQVKSLDDKLVDHATNVNIHGCALGRNQAMLRTLSQAIGGTDNEAPTIYAPKDLQVYGHTTSGGVTLHQEYLAEYWTVGYPTSKVPAPAQIAKDFAAQNPTAPGIDWAAKVASATRRSEPYDGEASLDYTIIPTKADKGGHQALLESLVPEAAQWSSWTVQDQTSTVQGERDVSKITYAYKKPDGNGGTKEGTRWFEIKNPRVPRTAAEKEAYARAELGADFDKYSWTYNLADPGGKPGTTVTAVFKYTGSRTIFRIHRDLTDAAGNKLDPSRTDAAHYGTYAPPQPPPATTTTP